MFLLGVKPCVLAGVNVQQPRALMILLVSVCCDTVQALVFLLVSVCCDTAQTLPGVSGVLAGVSVL